MALQIQSAEFETTSGPSRRIDRQSTSAVSSMSAEEGKTRRGIPKVRLPVVTQWLSLQDYAMLGATLVIGSACALLSVHIRCRPKGLKR